MTTALPQGIRRFEVRFRQPESDAPHLPWTVDRDFVGRAEALEPEAARNSESMPDDRCDGEHRFVRQPVKILLVPRRRLVR